MEVWEVWRVSWWFEASTRLEARGFGGLNLLLNDRVGSFWDALRLGIRPVFMFYVRVPLFLLVHDYKYVALRHIRLLFKVKTMNTGH